MAFYYLAATKLRYCSDRVNLAQLHNIIICSVITVIMHGLGIAYTVSVPSSTVQSILLSYQNHA